MTGHEMLMFDRAACAGRIDVSVSLHRHARGTKPPRFLILLYIRATDTSNVSRSLDPIEAAALAAKLEETYLLALHFGPLYAQVQFSGPDALRIAHLLRRAITVAADALAGNFAPPDSAVVEPDA